MCIDQNKSDVEEDDDDPAAPEQKTLYLFERDITTLVTRALERDGCTNVTMTHSLFGGHWTGAVGLILETDISAVKDGSPVRIEANKYQLAEFIRAELIADGLRVLKVSVAWIETEDRIVAVAFVLA